MSRYIDAEKALEIIFEAYPLLQKDYMRKVIDSIPTADVQEVKHGHWYVYGNTHYCSVCHEAMDIRTSYCPNCGARMVTEDE